MTMGIKRNLTRNQVARFKAISKSKQAQAEAPAQDEAPAQGEVVKMRKYALADVAPFDAMIGFTETSRGIGSNGKPYTTLKGTEFTVDGTAYVRTSMAYGDASIEVNKLLDAGATTLEVQLTPLRNIMKITGLVVDGTFIEFPDDRPAEEESRAAA